MTHHECGARRRDVVEPFMQDASGPARFRPTWRQAVGRGCRLGVLAALGCATAGLAMIFMGRAPTAATWWLWPSLAGGPVLIGVLGGAVGRRLGTDVDAGGIRTVSAFTRAVQPWSRVVDLRAERRGNRTVVAVYLDSGGSMQLTAPYDGGLFAADPRFESKVFALAHLWRSHRFGGVPG